MKAFYPEVPSSRPEVETASGKHPSAECCLMSLAKGTVEFITVHFSRPQRNEESSLRAQKIPQYMVLTSSSTLVWQSSPSPLKQWALIPFHLWITIVWSGRGNPYIQVRQRSGVIITMQTLPGILNYKWALVAKQSAILVKFKAYSWRKVEESYPDPLWSRTRLSISRDVSPTAPL